MQQKTVITFLKENIKSLIVPLGMIALGLILIFNPTASLKLITQIIGCLLIVGGVIAGFSLMAAFSPTITGLAVILVLLGIIVVANPVGVSTFVVKIFGLCILINACFRIHDALLIRDQNDSHFGTYVVNDIITAVLGLLLLVLSYDILNTVFIVIGIVMAVLGITNIITAYKVYKVGKYVEGDDEVVWEE
jgi:uncharacterized membrane protein HdeD (DUF308 family)